MRWIARRRSGCARSATWGKSEDPQRPSSGVEGRCYHVAQLRSSSHAFLLVLLPGVPARAPRSRDGWVRRRAATRAQRRHDRGRHAARRPPLAVRALAGYVDQPRGHGRELDRDGVGLRERTVDEALGGLALHGPPAEPAPGRRRVDAEPTWRVPSRRSRRSCRARATPPRGSPRTGT